MASAAVKAAVPTRTCVVSSWHRLLEGSRADVWFRHSIDRLEAVVPARVLVLQFLGYRPRLLGV